MNILKGIPRPWSFFHLRYVNENETHADTDACNNNCPFFVAPYI